MEIESRKLESKRQNCNQCTTKHLLFANLIVVFLTSWFQLPCFDPRKRMKIYNMEIGCFLIGNWVLFLKYICYYIFYYFKLLIIYRWETVGEIKELVLYPLKSAKGIKLTSAEATKYGLFAQNIIDRWAVLNLIVNYDITNIVLIKIYYNC